MLSLKQLAASALIVAGTPLVAAPAWATPTNNDNVTLCHRTDADNNPYVQITVDPASVFKQGHDGHDGPVWNPSLKANHEKWGDIIPPFDYSYKSGNKTVSGHYDGKNWTNEGRSLYDAGCQTPQPSPSPSATSTPTETATPTETPTQTPTETPSSTPSETPTETQSPSESPSTTVSPTSSESPTESPSESQSPTPGVTVMPTNTTRPPAPPTEPPGPGPLPFTGTSFPVLPTTFAGIFLVLAGAVLLRRAAK